MKRLVHIILILFYSNYFFGQTFTLGIQSVVGNSCGACPSACDPTYCQGGPTSGSCSPVVTVSSSNYSVPAGSRVEVTINSNMCESNSGLDNEDNIKLNGTTILTGSANLNVNYNNCFFNNTSNPIDVSISLTANRRSETITVSLNIVTGDNGCSILPTPLSIIFETFTTTLLDKKISLKWTTASEKDNVGFEIERSRDGYQFEKIGFVAGNLNSSSLQYYQFIDDKLVENRYYYRLKAVDKFGNTDFSEIRTVSTKLENKLFIQPTLVTDWLEINTNSTTNGKIILNDINGATLNQIEVEKDSQFKMNVSDLVSGIYFIHFVDELGNHTSQKFIKN